MNDGDATCITVGTAYSGKPCWGGVCKYRMKSFAARKAKLFFSHGLFQPGHNNRGHDDGPALRHTDTNGPCECMLVQVHALYPEGHGNNGHTVDEENGGWRCVDPTGGHQDMFSLKDLPADFVKTNKIEASDSGNSYLSISSATKRRVRRRRNNDGDDDQDDEANMISIHPGAKVSIKRGVEESRRRLDEGGRRLIQAGDPRGARALLVLLYQHHN